MGSSCKYSYLSGACANRHVDSLQCIGEDKCQFAGLNVIIAKSPGTRYDAPSIRNWLGLYCEKHGRFHCPGGDDCLDMTDRTKPAGLRTPRLSHREEP